MIRIDLKIPEELNQKAFEEAHQLKMSKSEFIRKCVEGYFKRKEKVV